MPLEGRWQDSIYTAEIEYPELVRIDSPTLGRWGIQPDEVPEWPEIYSSIGVSRGSATFNAGFMPLVRRDGSIYAINSYKSVIRAIPAVHKTRDAVPADSVYTRTSVLASGKWVKIKVSESGVHKLTTKSLRSMGFKDPSAVRVFGYGGEVLPETELQYLPDDLPEQAVWQEGDNLLFYAKGPVAWERTDRGFVHNVNTYSDYGYYFLTDMAKGPRARFETLRADTVPGVPVDMYPDFSVYDPDEFSWYRSGRRLF